ncbi:hypothetical protein AB0K93_31015 [Streptomyces sp. NPDC052676]|uniref:hypothetical protein n=1 Tax=Streptomyces sp. NPDC052676 TaxID=3154953 RepID=UPI00341A42D6
MTASADTSRVTAPAASYDIRVAADAPLWGDVNANTLKGTTDSSGSGALATCKRWSDYFDGWMYWIRHNELGTTGYVGSWNTNLTHSHLNRCS